MASANLAVGKCLNYLSNAVVVRVGGTSSSGFREWSDRTLEQWSLYRGNGGRDWQHATISFQIPFANTSYVVVGQGGLTDIGEHVGAVAVGIANKTKTNFKVSFASDTDFMWYAIGKVQN